jgi:hypothetical protein
VQWVITSTNVCCDICWHLQTFFCNAHQLSVSCGYCIIDVKVIIKVQFPRFSWQSLISCWSPFGFVCCVADKCSDILEECIASIFRMTESGSGGCWRKFGQLELGELWLAKFPQHPPEQDSVTLKMEAVQSSEMSEYSSNTQHRNPKEIQQLIIKNWLQFCWRLSATLTSRRQS